MEQQRDRARAHDHAIANGEDVVLRAGLVRPMAALALAVGLELIPHSSLVEDGSGWIPIWHFLAVVLAAGNLWSLLRRRKVVVGEAGVTNRTAWRTRSWTWSEIRGVREQVNSTGRRWAPRSWAIRQAMIGVVGGREHTLVHTAGGPAEPIRVITAYAQRVGATHGFLPAPTVNPRWIIVAVVLAGGAVAILGWGFGVCRFGSCGEGSIPARFATQADPTWVEGAIRDELTPDRPVTRALCPGRVDNDPTRTFSCTLFSGTTLLGVARVHFTSRAHNAAVFTYLDDPPATVHRD
jgi:hypothetical protein